MVRLFVRHPVSDYSTWREHYDAFDDERRGLGVVDDAVYQSIDDPNDVTAWHDFASGDEAKAFAASPRLQQVMSESGVAGEPTIWFVTGA